MAWERSGSGLAVRHNTERVGLERDDTWDGHTLSLAPVLVSLGREEQNYP